MAAERKTLSAQVDKDSELARDFEEYRESQGMTSKSEAVRTLVRDSLEQMEDNQEQRQPAPGVIQGFATTLAAHLSAYAVGTGVLTMLGILELSAGTLTAGAFLAGSVALMVGVYIDLFAAIDRRSDRAGGQA